MDKNLKTLLKKFSKNNSGDKNIIGLVFLGRPDLDQHDDIDIVAFVSGKVKIRPGEYLLNGYDFDITVIDYDYAQKTKWGQKTRSSFKYFSIILDRGYKTKNLLKNKLKFTAEEQKNIIVSGIFRLIWLGIYDDHRWKDYAIPYYPHDVWIKRGDIEEAHEVLDLGTDMLLEILYALNKEFIPAKKRRLHNSYSLKWKPKDYKKRMDSLLKEKISEKDFERRYKIIKELLKDILNKIEKEKILPEKIHHHFVKHDGFYTLRPKLD